MLNQNSRSHKIFNIQQYNYINTSIVHVGKVKYRCPLISYYALPIDVRTVTIVKIRNGSLGRNLLKVKNIHITKQPFLSGGLTFLGHYLAYPQFLFRQALFFRNLK